MKIQEQDLYHGAALTQIVESASFTALNRDPDKYGLYVINHDRRVLIKHSVKPRHDGRYQFTFGTSDITTLNQHSAHPEKTFVALVCGQHVICGLNLIQLGTIIDLGNASQQWVTVEAPAGKSLRTRGSLGDGPLVPVNRFPKLVLE